MTQGLCFACLFSLLLLGASCLAKFRDGVWYGGKVVDVHDNGSYTVMFDAYDDETLQVEGEDIIPAGESGESSGSFFAAFGLR